MSRRRVSISLSALCWVALLAAAACVCPDGWAEVRYADSVSKCYKLSEELHTFTQCQEYVCGPLGGTLACVESAEENAAVHRLVSDAGRANGTHWAAWLGFYESKSEGKWAWTSVCSSTFTSWHEGEPNDWCVEEDCALIYPDQWGGGWFDAACQVKAGCLCQYGLETSKDYNDVDVLQALREGVADYEGCKAAEQTTAALQETVRTSRAMLAGLLVLVLSVNVAVLVVAIVICRRQWAFRPQAGTSSSDQPLAAVMCTQYSPPSYGATEDQSGARNVALSQQA